MSENEEVEKQDLHITEPRAPDVNWARLQPIQMAPSQDRLDKPHQIVSVRNVSDVQVLPGNMAPRPQTHIVIDRFWVGHELRPGQRKDGLDLLCCDIEMFLRERASNRSNGNGGFKPLHPIVIEGFKPIEKAEPHKDHSVGRKVA